MINGTDIDAFYRRLGISKEKERQAAKKETESDDEKNEARKKTYSSRLVTSTKDHQLIPKSR